MTQSGIGQMKSQKLMPIFGNSHTVTRLSAVVIAQEIACAIQNPMPLLRSAGTYQSEHGYNRVARVEA